MKATLTNRIKVIPYTAMQYIMELLLCIPNLQPTDTEILITNIIYYFVPLPHVRKRNEITVQVYII